MMKFLISCILLLGLVAPAAAEPLRPGIDYTHVYTITDPNAKSSYWRLWNAPDGRRVLVIVKRPKTQKVRTYPTLPPIDYAPAPTRAPRVETSVSPIIIHNPYVKD